MKIMVKLEPNVAVSEGSFEPLKSRKFKIVAAVRPNKHVLN